MIKHGKLILCIAMSFSLFGGIKHTFAESTISAIWTNINPSTDVSIDLGNYLQGRGNTTIGGRAWFPLAYDNKRNVTVLFGGSGGDYLSTTAIDYSNQLWHYNYTTNIWTLTEPEIGCPNSDTWPNGRDNHELEYDEKNDVYWMFGGTGGECGDPNRRSGTWFYSPSARKWTKVAVTDFVRKELEESRFDPGFAYSPDHNMILLFGGEQYSSKNDTWSFDTLTKTWQRIYPNGDPNSPAPRGQAESSMVYDKFHKVFILFGGSGRQDTWVFNPVTMKWKEMHPELNGLIPAGREAHAMTYDSIRHLVILHGGASNYNAPGEPFNDVWIYAYSLNKWINITPPNSPGRRLHDIAYDELNDVVVLFSGVTTPGKTVGDTWILKLTGTIPATDSNPPSSPTGLIAK